MNGWTKLYPFSKKNESICMMYVDRLAELAELAEAKGDYENAEQFEMKASKIMAMFYKPNVNTPKVVYLTGAEIVQAKKILAIMA